MVEPGDEEAVDEVGRESAGETASETEVETAGDTSAGIDTTPFVSPMFPLGSVLFPTMLLPLHVFEPRYRALMSDVLAGDATFGVTLIERGSEVGGGDVRSEVGCLAKVLEAEELPDGRWHLVAVGAERIAIEEWLLDDPYPRARVRRLPDVAPAGSATDDLRWLELDGAFRELLRLVERASGSPVGADITLAEDPGTATFQMAALTPIGPLDRQQVLAATSADERRTLLLESFDHLTFLVNGGDSN